MEDMRFDGKVVLITGAGNGMGRDYALEFAKRGAKVVVNDLGSTKHGISQTEKVADKVVNEIHAFNGIACADYNSVVDGGKLVQTALENFGKIDIVIHNAGIVRDRTIGRMSDVDWDLTIDVHLKGAFTVVREAWPHMKRQKIGRIIFTSSVNGVYGAFGHANYAAAKLGLVGLANTLTLEGKKYNIKVNTISPIAATRLTDGEDFLKPENFSLMNSKYIVPLVLYLSHESCQESGGLFEAMGGHFSQLRWEKTKGALLRLKDQEVKPEDVRDNWNAITDWTKTVDLPQMQHNVFDDINFILKRIKDGDSDLFSNHPIQPELAKSHSQCEQKYSYTDVEVLLYARAIGASVTHADDIKFLFEMNENFCVIPTFVFARLVQVDDPGLSLNRARVVHGEQYLKFFKSLSPHGDTLTAKSNVVEVLDKGSGAAIVRNYDIFDSSGSKVCFAQHVRFAIGYGKFGGKRSSSEIISSLKPPNRTPDAVSQEKTTKDQAGLYRLCGDRNPLHIDPKFAGQGGFKEPILHGLCTLGFATRQVMRKYADNDMAKLDAVKVRFSGIVIPGETLKTEMWKENDRVYFKTIVVETGKVCLSDCYLDLKNVNSKL